jgi:hypothetical protein
MKSRNYLWIWLFLACATTHLLFLVLYAMRMGPHESSENNGYGNILALPFIGILGVAIIVLACLYPRRAATKPGTAKVVKFIAFYAIAATAIYNLPFLYGGYTARFKLVDLNSNPISGMRAEFLQQRSDASIWAALCSVFFVQDYTTVDYSDDQGIVRAPANVNTRLGAFINLKADDSTPVNPKYFIVDLLLAEQMNTPSLTLGLYPSWRDQKDGRNETRQVSIPFRDPILITIPDRAHISTRSGK